MLSRVKEDEMIGGSYKNIVLVLLIISALFAFMIFSWQVVIKDINQGRSCVKTCDTPTIKVDSD
jgi:hypothetical protein